MLQSDFPHRDLVAKYGPYFFTTGQAPWILAYAIEQNPTEIGIWGVEAIDKYSPQRKEIQHFVQIARDRGIKITVPENCTLLDSAKSRDSDHAALPPLYAFSHPLAT